MEKNTLVLIGALTTFVLALVIIFFSAALSAAFGALAGWLVALWFPATAAKIVASTGYAIYQLGAIVAFIGSFFKTIVPTK